MSNRALLVKEICDLVIVWHAMRDTPWFGAKLALEERINALCEEAGLIP